MNCVCVYSFRHSDYLQSMRRSTKPNIRLHPEGSWELSLHTEKHEQRKEVKTHSRTRIFNGTRKHQADNAKAQAPSLPFNLELHLPTPPLPPPSRWLALHRLGAVLSSQSLLPAETPSPPLSCSSGQIVLRSSYFETASFSVRLALSM